MEEKNLICIGCPMGCPLTVKMENREVTSVTGNTCKRGDVYARKEVTRNKLQDKVDLRLGSGIEVLKENESQSDKVKLILDKFKGIILSKKQKEVIDNTEKGILENAIASITVDKINATYLLGAIERAKTKSKYLVDGINPFKFNNFKAREYDYDSLEKKLLGWDKQEDVIEEEQLPLGIGWLGV